MPKKNSVLGDSHEKFYSPQRQQALCREVTDMTPLMFAPILAASMSFGNPFAVYNYVFAICQARRREARVTVSTKRTSLDNEEKSKS